MFRLFLTIPVILTACLKDETVSGFAETGANFHLVEIDGTPFTARSTISFPDQGSVRGQAPCNAYSADQSAPYPWFALGPIAVTRAACDDLPKELLFFEALSSMTQIEVFADTVILRNDDMREMIFRAR